MAVETRNSVYLPQLDTMLSRPVDASGDILPVLSASDLLSGSAAVAAGLSDHLNLFTGDWWEYAERGNPVFDLISLSRRTDQDAAALTSCLCSWVLAFPGVQSVSDAQAGFAGRVFSFSCIAHTESGEVFPVSFSS